MKNKIIDRLLFANQITIEEAEILRVDTINIPSVWYPATSELYTCDACSRGGVCNCILSNRITYHHTSN